MISLQSLFNPSERYKITILKCSQSSSEACRMELADQGLVPINIGKELAEFVKALTNPKHLGIRVSDCLTKLIKERKTFINELHYDGVAIYNLGILFEPQFELNPAHFLKETSKVLAIIIVWEYQVDDNGLLAWSDQNHKANLNFSDIPVKTIDYEIQRPDSV